MPIPYAMEFEQPLVEIEGEIRALEGRAEVSGDDYSDEITGLRTNHDRLLKKIYEGLSASEIVRVARHPERPQTADYIRMIAKDFVELHGDRRFGEDPAIIAGFGRIGPHKCMIVGHNKGKDTNEKIACHFGCAHPEGYRKALAKMKLA
ncbi:MAG: acetyl-CoA carboxylase carboxyl transferase subunit alpha, partial [Planctomycetota bacterium]